MLCLAGPRNFSAGMLRRVAISLVRCRFGGLRAADAHASLWSLTRGERLRYRATRADSDQRRASEAITQRLRDELFRRLQRLRASFYDTADTGDFRASPHDDPKCHTDLVSGTHIGLMAPRGHYHELYRQQSPHDGDYMRPRCLPLQ